MWSLVRGGDAIKGDAEGADAGVAGGVQPISSRSQ
jgi:hypothetical protein